MSRQFILYSRERGQQPRDWSGNNLSRTSVDSLRAGDIVRLVLVDPLGQSLGVGWECIYFEIIRVDFYKKGGVNRPRKFEGKAMNTYRLDPEENLRYVKTGQVIHFQRQNIIEIPGWKSDEISTAGLQPSKELITKFLIDQQTRERKMFEIDRTIEFKKRREKKKTVKVIGDRSSSSRELSDIVAVSTT